uniref:NAD(P)/FAD-dependent oxidoreductase n=1 Tax=Candidatus Electronema sp. TaxID=2698783 RepID=UPI004057AE8B
MEYLIVGGSAAAASGLAAIRRNRPQARIGIVADEPAPFYYRPLIPFLIDGSRTADEIFFDQPPPAAWGAELIHDQCVGIEPKRHAVRLRSGRELRYGKLLLAAGGAPVSLLPHLAGAESEGVFTLRSLEDALQIRQHLPGCRAAVVVGGGLVGIKAAEALLRAGLAVTVVEQQAQILPLRADAFAAEAVAKRLRAKGMKILTGESPVEITTAAGRANGLRLAGRTIAADLIVLAAGARPNTNFLQDAGLEIERGVVVDKQMRTSAPDICAAGDLIQFIDQADGATAVSGLWSNAVHSGRVAGDCLSGGRAELPPLLSVMNSTEIAGLPLLSAGVLDDGGGRFTAFAESCGENYRKLLFEQDRLAGMIFLGSTEGAGVCANLIRSRTALGPRRDAVLREAMKSLRQF